MSSWATALLFLAALCYVGVAGGLYASSLQGVEDRSVRMRCALLWPPALLLALVSDGLDLLGAHRASDLLFLLLERMVGLEPAPRPPAGWRPPLDPRPPRAKARQRSTP